MFRWLSVRHIHLQSSGLQLHKILAQMIPSSINHHQRSNKSGFHRAFHNNLLAGHLRISSNISLAVLRLHTDILAAAFANLALVDSNNSAVVHQTNLLDNYRAEDHDYLVSNRAFNNNLVEDGMRNAGGAGI